jgi:nucleotide-binding universal stress UspA family protein
MNERGKADDPGPPGAVEVHPSDGSRAALRKSIETFRHFLICLDRSELGERVLAHAACLADTFSARVTLLHVLEPMQDSGGPADALNWEIGRVESRSYLEELSGRLREGGLEVVGKLAQGRAAEQILQETRAGDIDVAVMASHGAGGLSDWDLSSTVHKVVARSRGSVLVVPVEHPSAGYKCRRLAVPLDGSLRAECVLPIVSQIAVYQKAEVLLIHAVPEMEHGLPRMRTREDREMARQLEGRHEELAHRYLDDIRGLLERNGASVRTILRRDGDFRRVLYDIVERERPDLLVLAAHGRTGSGDAPFGKVAMECIHRPPAPLLVIQDLSPEEVDRCLRRERGSARPRESRLWHEETL